MGSPSGIDFTQGTEQDRAEAQAELQHTNETAVAVDTQAADSGDEAAVLDTEADDGGAADADEAETEDADDVAQAPSGEDHAVNESIAASLDQSTADGA